MKEVNINLKEWIFSIDKHTFCIINGGPGIIRNIMRYSIEELDIYLLIFNEYLL